MRITAHFELVLTARFVAQKELQQRFLSLFAIQGRQGGRFHQPQPTSLAAPHVGRRIVALRIRAHT